VLAVTFTAAVLVALTVAIHAAGLAVVLSRLVKSRARPPTRAWPITLLLVRLAWLLILIHAAEISVWALFYRWQRCLPDLESAFYFSGVTYATIGYGDLVLAKPWRILGPVEGVTGILMCGLSAGLFFATVNRIYAPRLEETRQ
jgi:Ion channel